MPYGIANQNGQMNFSDISMIFDLAWGNGINSLYTTKAYGESEGSIGKYLKQHLGFELIKKAGYFCIKET